MRAVTKEIAELIMFEIGKTEADSIKEVERYRLVLNCFIDFPCAFIH